MRAWLRPYFQHAMKYPLPHHDTELSVDVDFGTNIFSNGAPAAASLVEANDQTEMMLLGAPTRRKWWYMTACQFAKDAIRMSDC